MFFLNYCVSNLHLYPVSESVVQSVPALHLTADLCLIPGLIGDFNGSPSGSHDESL